MRNPKKLHSIKQMLNVYMQDEEVVANCDDTDDMNRVETTVFEISGVDRPGLLADVMDLLTHNGCDVRSAAVWTYQGRVAFVFSVTEKGKPVAEDAKVQRLQQVVSEIMGATTSTVGTHRIRGEVHHDRRLHQLMLQEEKEDWDMRCAGSNAHHAQLIPPVPSINDTSAASVLGATTATSGAITIEGSSDASGSGSSPSHSAMSTQEHDQSPPLPSINIVTAAVTGSAKPGMLAGTANVSPFRSPKFDKPTIDISYCTHPDYWTVNIRCRDRTKLLFDTVCTLADMNYDIYHATIDCGSDGWAYQEFFIRPRSGEGDFDAKYAALLKAMLQGSIERRFPKGLKVHVRSLDRYGCLAGLARQLLNAGLTVTRAKVRTFATSKSSGHTLYVMDAHGGPPDKHRVQESLILCGGKLVDNSSDGKAALIDSHRFSFSFMQRQWGNVWGGSPTESVYGSL